MVLFCFVLFGNDCVFYCLFYILICLLFICLALNPPNWQKYMDPYLVSISDILIRVLSIVFTSDLRLVFKPYLTRIGPVQSWNERKPFANHSVLILLLASHIHIPYQIVWERLTIKFKLVISSYGNEWFYKFVKVHQN